MFRISRKRRLTFRSLSRRLISSSMTTLKAPTATAWHGDKVVSTERIDGEGRP